ncbi:MAG: hypothetical protein Ta2E_09370 [Mycoplasmoidaceae bacterium]|nr:MAG: hypothetical protein Ta2E_09370 [Mycoplasmoidaceae bacterium]
MEAIVTEDVDERWEEWFEDNQKKCKTERFKDRTRTGPIPWQHIRKSQIEKINRSENYVDDQKFSIFDYENIKTPQPPRMKFHDKRTLSDIIENTEKLCNFVVEKRQIEIWKVKNALTWKR